MLKRPYTSPRVRRTLAWWATLRVAFGNRTVSSELSAQKCHERFDARKRSLAAGRGVLYGRYPQSLVALAHLPESEHV